MELFALFGVFEDTGIGLAEHRFIKAVAKSFCGFSHLLIDFVIEFSDFVFDEHIGAVSLFRVLIVNQRVVKGIDMT